MDELYTSKFVTGFKDCIKIYTTYALPLLGKADIVNVAVINVIKTPKNVNHVRFKAGIILNLGKINKDANIKIVTEYEIIASLSRAFL